MYYTYIDARKGVLKKPNFKNSMFQFIKDTRAEMVNVTWPSRKKTIFYTLAVVIISGVVAYYLGFLDMLFAKGIGYIITK